jgi:hypothetical protein
VTRSAWFSNLEARLGILFLLLVSLFQISGKSSSPLGSGTLESPYLVPETEGDFRIDGLLNEEAWNNALTLELKYEIQPGENTPSPIRTEVLLTYDSKNLYSAFRCFDGDPTEIRARLTDREDFFGDDHVNIHIDTFNDERRHFTIGANPQGVQMDAIATEHQFDWSWDAIFESAGKIYDWGYVVEMAIPFSQLRFQRAAENQIWGFDAWRVYPRSVERFLGVVPSDRNNNCRACQMVKIQGFNGISPGKNVELVPTVTGVRTDARESLPDRQMERLHQDVDAGITGRWGMTPNLTFSATLNPDFSQVEADARQLDINQPFALHYQERRPFFQEGADFFQSPLIEAVYTRSLRDPIWGVKISGKEGDNTIAGFVVKDRLTNLILPSSQSSDYASLLDSSFGSVARYRRDIGNRYTIGTLFTSREGDSYHNRVFGFDSDLRLTNKDRILFQFLGSNTRYPGDLSIDYDQPLGAFSDRAFELNYEHETRSFHWSAGTENYGKRFRSDLGFVPQVDYRNYQGELGYRWVPETDSWFSTIRVNGSFRYEEDQSGNLLQRRADIFALYGGPLQSIIAARVYRSRQAYNGAEFDIFYYGTFTGITPNRYVTIQLDTSFGNKIDYANTRLGDRIRLNPILTLNLGNHLNIDLDHQYEKLDVEGGELYIANVSQGTLVYQFNVRTFVRSILQYVDYRYNTDLYDFEMEPRFRQLFTQFLFSYKINPRTVLFIGYSDNHYGNQDYPLTQADRTLFAKIGYAFQF